MRVLSFGDMLPAGRFRVHSRFSRAVNFMDGEDLVSAVDPWIGDGPLNIVLDGFLPGRIEGEVRIEDGLFVFGDERFPAEPPRRYDSSIGLSASDGSALLSNLGVFKETLLRFAPEGSLAFALGGGRPKAFSSGFGAGYAVRVREGLREFENGDFAGGAALLKGTGFGLTPGGDDFLAGSLLGMNVLELAGGASFASEKGCVFENAVGGNPISNAFLRSSFEGRLSGRFKKLLKSLAGSDREMIVDGAKGLMELGETSGADMAAGFLFSVELLAGSAVV